MPVEKHSDLKFRCGQIRKIPSGILNPASIIFKAKAATKFPPAEPPTNTTFLGIISRYCSR